MVGGNVLGPSGRDQCRGAHVACRRGERPCIFRTGCRPTQLGGMAFVARANYRTGVQGGAVPGKAVAIVQSNYVPWKGYFDLMNSVDEFILYDDAQYTRRDWRNRNRIKTPHGAQWMTIPVLVKGRYHQRINETVVSDGSWARDHWDRLSHSYGRAVHFRAYREVVREWYEAAGRQSFLSQVNHTFLCGIFELLGIRARITWSMDYELADGRTERLVGLCKQARAGTYVSGPAARAYLDESLFAAEGIDVRYIDYGGYPEYPQPFPPFEHAVTVLDLLFSTGPDAPRYMKSF